MKETMNREQCYSTLPRRLIYDVIKKSMFHCHILVSSITLLTTCHDEKLQLNHEISIQVSVPRTKSLNSCSENQEYLIRKTQKRTLLKPQKIFLTFCLGSEWKSQLRHLCIFMECELKIDIISLHPAKDHQKPRELRMH